MPGDGFEPRALTYSVARSTWIEKALVILLLAGIIVGLLNYRATVDGTAQTVQNREKYAVPVLAELQVASAGIAEFNDGNPLYLIEHHRTQRLVCAFLDEAGATPDCSAVPTAEADAALLQEHEAATGG